MNMNLKSLVRVLRLSVLLGGACAAVHAQTPIQWGLTVVNINNPIDPLVVTNADGSISITGGGGDTYSKPDSFTYAYQQVTGDFDIKVRILNVEATDPQLQDSPKAALMVRKSLDPDSLNFQINALPLAPSGRDGQIESIGRISPDGDTDDLPGRGSTYGGDTTDKGYCTYPDLWFRIQRQGDKFMSYFATTNTTDFPSGTSPGSTNGWQLLVIAPAGTNFPATVYIGLATVAHNSDIADTEHTVTATYAAYGPTTSPSIPTAAQVPVAPDQAPGKFPVEGVIAVNWDMSLPADGNGYPSDIVQSEQGPAAPIIWNDSGFGSVSRDVLVDLVGQSPLGFSVARYQAGAFDFLISPRDPVLSRQNLGPYSNPLRERISGGSPNVPASQAWAPSPNYGFVMATVRTNGASWNDQSPAFYAASYVQLDDSASAQGYDMIGGHFRGAQFYTRTTKLVTGVELNGPESGKLQRGAVPLAIAWFPYQEGWKAGYFAGSKVDPENPGKAQWKRGNGWGLHSGTAISGLAVTGGQSGYNSPAQILTWLPDPDGTINGLAQVQLAGVKASDGLLFTVANEENSGIRGPSANNAALADDSGWLVAVRDIENSKANPSITATGSDSGSSFSFLFVPWTARNLVAAHVIGTNGTPDRSAGSFTIQRLSTGRYALTIPGKTDADGSLLLINSGYLANPPEGTENVVDNSFLSYQFGGADAPAGSFVIEARTIDASGGGEGTVVLRDADFNFVWVDFKNPLTLAAAPPALSVTTSNGSVTVSWPTSVAGYTLQGTGSLTSPTWAAVPGVVNNSVTVTPASGPQFYRLSQ